MLLNLKVHGPFNILSETEDILKKCPFAKDKGIYLWAAKLHSGTYKATYIGETNRSFYHRTKEHLIQTLGGNYQVCDPEKLLNDEKEILWNGLWRTGTRTLMPQFIKQYPELAPKIVSYLKTQVLFFIPFNLEKNCRRRIESALAQTVLNHPEASRLLARDIRYLKPKIYESSIAVNLIDHLKVEGLPRNFEA